MDRANDYTASDQYSNIGEDKTYLITLHTCYESKDDESISCSTTHEMMPLDWLSNDWHSLKVIVSQNIFLENIKIDSV